MKLLVIMIRQLVDNYLDVPINYDDQIIRRQLLDVIIY